MAYEHTYLKSYILPDALPEIIAAGRESAERHMRGTLTSAFLSSQLDFYYERFCVAARQDPTKIQNETENPSSPILSYKERRDNFQTMLIAISAMHAIGDGIVRMGGQPSTQLSADGEIRTRCKAWLDAMMSDAPAEKGRQEEALKILDSNLFKAPVVALTAASGEITRTIEPRTPCGGQAHNRAAAVHNIA